MQHFDKMKKLIIASLLGCLLINSGSAQDSLSTGWLAVRNGVSYSSISSFPAWGESEGLSNLPPSTRHQQIAFDVFFQKNKIPFQLSTEINLPQLSQTYPYLTSVSFESGYSLINNRLSLKALAGPSMGIMTVRFRTGVPDSFQNLPFNHNWAFARAYNLSMRVSLLASYPLFPKSSRWGRPVLIANAGFHQRLTHGGFRYGENQIVPDDRFVSVPVDMPKMFKRNVWISVGIGFRFY